MENIETVLTDLRVRLGAAGGRSRGRAGTRFQTGLADLDAGLGGGLRTGVVHEIFPEAADQTLAAHGFALALASRRGGRGAVWVAQGRLLAEAGVPYGLGVRDWGLDPDDLVLVRVRDAAQLLAAGEEALASGAADAVILSGWGESPALTLAAGRRLSFAADRGGGVALFVRASAEPRPSAAETRWSVAAAPSHEREARAPGRPAFRVRLTRSRTGAPEKTWMMEWDRERRSFVEPTAHGDLVSLPRHRPAGAAGRETGRAA